MKPHHWRVVTGVTKRLEFVIPCRTERDLQFALHVMNVPYRQFQRLPDAVLPDDHVACGIRLRMMDAEVRRVHPPSAV